MAIISPPKPVHSNLDEFGFSQSKFKIAVNNKAFKVLIDKLYSDKIQSIIRELSTNAYDSHIMAGCAERPFDVTLPTSLNPVFSIRDYGVSLSHEKIMTMYVTLFESDKDESNDQVGAFGLGSKSPFSYTDSFSVIAYLDGLKRSYIVGYDSEGIPNITHISTEDSDAERGFEVSFPVKYEDSSAFRDAATTVYRYFDVKPNCGIAFDGFTPTLAHGNWKLYNKKTYSRSVWVRQGCVAYPVTDKSLTDILSGLNTDIVIDVPIGSVSVTPSRESLSIDPETKRFLDSEFRRINEEILNVINDKFSEAPTILETQKVWRELNWMHYSLRLGAYQRPGMKNHIVVNGYWKITKENKLPKIYEFDKGKLELTTTVSFEHMQRCQILVDRGQPMVRKKMRLREYDKDNYFMVVVNPTNKELERLVRCFGLTKTQIIDITTIPDVEVKKKDPTSSAPAAPKTGVTVVDVLGDGTFKPDKDYVYPTEFYWVAVESADSGVKLSKFGKVTKGEFESVIKKYLVMLDLTDKPILLLTKQARARFDLDPAFELSTVIFQKAEDMKDLVNEARIAKVLCSYMDLDVAICLFPQEAELYAKSKTWPVNDHHFINLFPPTYSSNTEWEEAEKLRTETLKKYPLLGPRYEYGLEAIREYVEFINNKESK